MKYIARFTLALIFSLGLILPSTGMGVEPSSPMDLQASARMTYVDLSWKAPADNGGSPLTNYTLYKSTDPSTMSYWGNVTGNITAYHDYNVEAGDTYFYQVTVWNDANESTSSNMVVVTIPTPAKSDDAAVIGIIALAMAAIALQLGIIAIWVILRKGNKPS